MLGPCFVIKYFVSVYFAIILMKKRESWLLCFDCLPDALWQSLLCGSFSRYRELVCSV